MTEPTQNKVLKKIRQAENSPKVPGSQIKHYIQLMRLHKPIGIYLLLWPTLWALWLATPAQIPSVKNLLIFVAGVILMRSAGCIINDFADRKIDGNVKRTEDRPMATGAVSSKEALVLFALLAMIAFGLVLMTNTLTIQLSVGGLILAATYPFMKRHTHLPQVVLGAAFAWSVPMAFAAEAGTIRQEAWLIYLAVVLWTVVYDTFYAMVDRNDDIKIGVKSTAILFGEQDRLITGCLQLLTLYTLILVGQRFELGTAYYVSLPVVAGLFIYQQWLIRFRDRDNCFKAFLNNHWVGMAIFCGILADRVFKNALS
jgi:4-hydroxybenzoate polyprenyltransferase